MHFWKSFPPLLKNKNAFKEIPRSQRFADRPSLEEVLAGAKSH